MNDLNSGTNNSYGRSNKLNGTAVFFMITTLICLGAGIYLYANSVHKEKEATALTSELTTSETRYSDLDSKYSSVLADIESYKGKNAGLDSMLNAREKFITDLRANLTQERKKRQLSDTEYKTQLGNLNTMITDMNGKIEELQHENGMLTTQRDSLGKNLSETQTKVTELTTTNTSLSQKVTVASLLIPSNISITGVRDKSNGKQDETNKAAKVQHLKICFDVPANKVADAGSKTFYVRILNPDGSIISLQDQGSGTFTGVENNEQMQYTTSATMDYQQAKGNVCSLWNQNLPFVKGNYNAEIYQDGYLLGKQNFTLK